ncbi:GDP-mannose 4,6-dehydratase [Fulvivirga lutimaris]|uniref:GDP-mannose 4,6-dehydratase n=1 Tax=Fulvivirga lutimaris TaxID=1819566 RepID=UPI0012BB9160|nr:NAD-dependent epimerase/dehydratase family protein [Fulvivirga lutimaris]MTI39472.1 NAD-dependent epimerase/dehydratase family protein [Fulvivirga lutimaris]
MKRTILVTGCAGFIGSHVSERLLKQGHTIVGIDNFDPFYARSIKEENIMVFRDSSDFHFLEIDLVKDDFHKLLSSFDVDIVIHLAGKAGVRPSIESPQSYIDNNITGTLNLLNYMKDRKVNKMVFASSSSVYGNGVPPFAEDVNDNKPISPYAFTKRSCELMNHTYHSLYNIDFINLRFFTVYGPRQRPDLAINKFVRLINEELPIPFYGDGSTMRDYTYISDIVDGISLSMDYLTQNDSTFETINIGNNNPISLNDLVSTIGSILNKEVFFNQLPKQPGDVELTCADISKAEALIGYFPKITIMEGLTKFIDWQTNKTLSLCN